MPRCLGSLWFVLWLVIPPALAERVSLNYQVHADHFHVLDAQLVLQLSESRYQAKGQANTRGLLGFFFPYQMTTTATGILKRGQVLPVTFGNDGSFSDEERRVELWYDATGPEVRTLVPSPEEEEREPVPPALQVGTLDPLAAAILAAQQLSTTGRCPTEPQRIFDGRRLSEVTLLPVAMPLPADVTLPPGVGDELQVCELEAERLAGERHRDEERRAGPFQRREEAEKVPIRIWFARLAADLPWLPVVMERDGGWRILMTLEGWSRPNS